MQKLEARNTYTPMDIPHIRNNCYQVLIVTEIPSVPDLKTYSNISNAALTGFGRYRAESACTCCKNFSLLIREHDSQLSSKLTNIPRGSFLSAMRDGVPATPWPQCYEGVKFKCKGSFGGFKRGVSSFIG